MKKLRIDVMDMSLAGRVRFWRAQRGLSRTDLALQSGVSDGWLSHVEQGDLMRPDPAKLRQIAPILGTTYEDLMEAAGYMPAEPMPPELRDFIVLLQGMTPYQRGKILRMLYILMEPEQRPPASRPDYIS